MVEESLDFRIITLGCKVNQADSIYLGRELINRGCVPWDGWGRPRLIIVNTCVVTREAMKKSMKAVRGSLNRGEDHVVVTGCGIEYEPKAFRGIPGVSEVFSPQVEKARESFLRKIPCAESNKDPWNYVRDHAHPSRMRVPVKVQEGCDRRCAYCVVPLVRGPSRSREMGLIRDEVEQLEDAGVKEVVLTGIDMGDYQDPNSRGKLPQLLECLLASTSVIRFRLSSIEPDNVSGELAALIDEGKRVCRHLHIPLQSGDNRILAAMGRNYLKEEYLAKIKHLQEIIPGIAITTDMIVGFPGEDSNNFDASVQSVLDSGFAKVHVFRYSPRPGTRAASLEDTVNAGEKRRRAKELAAVAGEVRYRFHEGFAGETLEVLAEEPADDRGGILSGHSDNYIKVIFPGPVDLLGEISAVRVCLVDGDRVHGEVVTEPSGEKEPMTLHERGGR